MIFPLFTPKVLIQKLYPILLRFKDVVSVIIDVYQGNQIELGLKSITFEYEIINPNARNSVEKLLQGFGGILR